MRLVAPQPGPPGTGPVGLHQAHKSCWENDRSDLFPGELRPGYFLPIRPTRPVAAVVMPWMALCRASRLGACFMAVS